VRVGSNESYHCLSSTTNTVVCGVPLTDAAIFSYSNTACHVDVLVEGIRSTCHVMSCHGDVT